MQGDQVIAKILKAEGVEWMAAFPAQTLIDQAAREGIRPILCRQERAGVEHGRWFQSRQERQSGWRLYHADWSGAENAFAGVAQAFADSIPLLLLPGGQPRARTQVHPNFEAVPNYQGVTKWCANINLVSRIPELLGMAFSQLKHGRPGPVLVEIPRDVATEEFPDRAFNYTPVKPYTSGANPDDVRDGHRHAAASCPIINVGHGVLWAEATAELLALAELTHIPVMTTLAGKSAFPETHRLARHRSKLWHDVRPFSQKTDFVLG